MKRILKNLFIPTLSSLVILPIVGCSYQTEDDDPQPSRTSTLEIVSDIQDLNVHEEENYLSSPIQTKCIGPDKKEKQIDVKFNLKATGNDQLPNWICITDKNEIQLSGGKNIGKYSFTLSAFNEEQKLYSKPKIFNINVTSEREILPESISINAENEKTFDYDATQSIPFSIVPYKQGVEEKYLINKCTCELKYDPLYKDLGGNDLFTCVNENESYHVEMSKNIDKTYVKDFKFQIVATLTANPEIKATKTVIIHVTSSKEHFDPSSKCSFTKNESGDHWVLTKLETGNIIDNVPSEIEGLPVTEVADDFGVNSGITNITQVILPDSITKIGDRAFINQTALNSLQIPGVTDVGISAFENDSILELRAGSNLSKLIYIKEKAFYNCKLLKIEKLENVIGIGSMAFYNTGLTEISIGEECIELGNEVFAYCSNLAWFRVKAPNPPAVGSGILVGSDQVTKIRVPMKSLYYYMSDEAWQSQSIPIEGI